MTPKPEKKYTFKIKIIRDEFDTISDFYITEMDDEALELLKIKEKIQLPMSYKLLESKYNFNSTFFQMFVSNLDASPFGNFYFYNRPYEEEIYKIHYELKGDQQQVYVSADDKVTLREFEEINELRYFYENVFFNSSDAIFLIEYKNGEFRYITTNKIHRIKTGISFEMIHNKTPRELVGDELGTILENNYKQALTTDETITYEEYLELPGGPRYWQTYLKKLVIPKSNRIIILGTARDITELKHKQKKNLELIKQLEEANQVKDKFFTIIAHDLKNPLYNSQAISDLLYHNYDMVSTEEIKGYLKLLNLSLKNASELLNNLLTWASNQLNGLKIQPTPVLLSKVLEKVLEGFDINIREKNLIIHTENLKEIILYCDENSLYFILRNLLSNAIKFSHKDGKIHISARFADDMVQITIRDEGIGMNENVKKNLFSLVTTSSKGTSGEKGSGLGLVLVKELVDKNQGQIAFESQEGKGTTFYITLKAYKKE
jgi:PAS domain S-box-containing protein